MFRISHPAPWEGIGSDITEAIAHNPPHPQPIHQRGGERRNQAVAQQGDGHGGGDGPPGPAELPVQRIDQHPRARPETRGTDERDERGGGHEPGAVNLLHMSHRAKFNAGPEILAEADTVIIPGPGVHGPRQEGTLPRPHPGARADRADHVDLHRRVRARRGRPARRATGHDQLGARRVLPAALPPGGTGRERAVRRRRGLAAGVDLCLHVVRSDHGGAVANHTTRYCVVPPRRDGGQSQFIERPLPEQHAGSTAKTRAWALERLGEPLDLATLAEHARMSVRTFSRRFRAETGLSARAWLNQQRVLHAAPAGDHRTAHRPGGGGIRTGRRRVAAATPPGGHRGWRPWPTAERSHGPDRIRLSHAPPHRRCPSADRRARRL